MQYVIGNYDATPQIFAGLQAGDTYVYKTENHSSPSLAGGIYAATGFDSAETGYIPPDVVTYTYSPAYAHQYYTPGISFADWQAQINARYASDQQTSAWYDFGLTTKDYVEIAAIAVGATALGSLAGTAASATTAGASTAGASTVGATAAGGYSGLTDAAVTEGLTGTTGAGFAASDAAILAAPASDATLAGVGSAAAGSVTVADAVGPSLADQVIGAAESSIQSSAVAAVGNALKPPAPAKPAAPAPGGISLAWVVIGGLAAKLFLFT